MSERKNNILNQQSILNDFFSSKNNHTNTHSISYAPPTVIGASQKLSEIDLKKNNITMTYFVNLAQKHSLHEVIREIDTDSIYPAVHMPAHILLLLILKKCDIIYMIMSLYPLIKSNWSYMYIDFSINKFLAAIYRCRAYYHSFDNTYIHNEFFSSVLTLVSYTEENIKRNNPLMIN